MSLELSDGNWTYLQHPHFIQVNQKSKKARQRRNITALYKVFHTLFSWHMNLFWSQLITLASLFKVWYAMNWECRNLEIWESKSHKLYSSKITSVPCMDVFPILETISQKQILRYQLFLTVKVLNALDRSIFSTQDLLLMIKYTTQFL